jgi:hypothetical protein
MTIGLAISVNDGVVLASDSATSLIATDPTTGQTGVSHVYNSANKVFNLFKGSPIGGYTYGAGSIGPASISTLVKDFRQKLAQNEPIGASRWTFDHGSYALSDFATAFRHFLYEETYVPAYSAAPNKPPLGFTLAGYSSGASLPEVWQVLIEASGACGPPALLKGPGSFGVTTHGQPEAIQRLLHGFSGALPAALLSIGLPPADLPAALKVIQAQTEVTLSPPAMPIQDVLELAEFLVHLTIMYSRFTGPPTVGGPIEIAAITKHEGFKWVKRKHYYPADLNPEDPHV